MAAGLAAVQILPSWELNSLSERAARDVPRNVYEAAAEIVAPADADLVEDMARWDGLLGKSGDRDSHPAAAYDFSVGPWRLAEYLWPNVAGREFPTNRRWMSAIPAEGRVWVPSFYMGLLPLALALAAWRVRRADVRTRWLSWLVLLSVLGSFGVFGLGRLLREIAVQWNETLADPQNAVVGDPFGGVYWLLTVLLPGYAQFRYPAKLLVVAALGLSLLAARGWDDVVSGSPSGRRARRLLMVFALTSVGCLAIALAIRSSWMGWFAAAPKDLSDPLFGPLDTDGAWSDLCWGFAQTALVGLITWWVMHRATSTPAAGSSRGAGRWACAAVALTAIDLGIANRWMIVAAPARAWQTPSLLADAIRANEASPDQPFRVDRPDDVDLWPKAWSTTSSPNRQVDGLARDRDTLLPKHALAESIEMLQAPDTSAVLDYQVFLDGIGRWSKSRNAPRDGGDGHPGGLDALGVRYLILPPGLRPPGKGQWQLVRTDRDASTPAAGGSQTATAPSWAADVRLWKNSAPLPRAWLVRQIDVLPPLGSRRPSDIAQRTSEVLFPNGQPRDFRTSAAVEADEAEVRLSTPAAASSRAAGGAASDRCRIVTYQPNRVELDVDVAEPGGLLVLSDSDYPGWQADVETDGVKLPRRAPILRTNRVMRGVALPPGRHRITFFYRPSSVIWGAAVSAAAWLVLLGLAAIRLRRRAWV